MIGRSYKLLRFENRPEVRKFTRVVNRRIHNWCMAEEIASELINAGYIIALKKLGYKDAPKNIAFSKDYAKKHGISFVDAFMFGRGGAVRIALFEWLIEKNLRGMHRSGKAPGPTFSEEAKKTWYLAEYKHQLWPHIEDTGGEFYPVEFPAEHGKLPQPIEEVMHDSWRRYLRKGKDYAYTGMRPLRCGQNYQMIEDMVCTLFEDEGRLKMYRSPLSRSQQLRYNWIIENANRKGVDSFYAVYTEMFGNPDSLKPIWDKARRILYDYSGVIRQSAIDAGLIEKPDSIGITRRKKRKGWQAQIAFRGRQKYLGLFKNKADALTAYYEAAAKMGHIPGLPDIDKIWPTWEQEKAHLALMDEHPQMPIIYQQQDTHEERKFGLQPPKYLRDFVERMANVGWLAKHCILAFDDNCPVASREVTIESRGANWYAEIKEQGKRTVICGSTSIDRDTGRIRITIYNQGFDNKRVLAEEIYHIGFKIIRLRYPKIFEAIQRWYNHQLKRGGDPTFSMPDMFSTNMALEEFGEKTSLGRQMVNYSRNIFSVNNKIPNSVMKEVKTKWSVL